VNGVPINMVSIPSGSFQMGCLNTHECSKDQKPVHTVTLNAFKMSKTQVTFNQWGACVTANGCSYKPDDQGWGRGRRPVMNVSYDDIAQ
jgi:formylglycine-generating enzyme required for sulfatase activity